MALPYYNVSVPGSLMLLGEHAVLYGKQSLVCAINKRLNMQLQPVKSTTITITDTRLGTVVQNLADLQVAPPFTFVLRTILEFRHQIASGFNLKIESEFSSVLGFGSSAAVIVATIAVLNQWVNSIPLSDAEIFILAKKIMLSIQSVGSGADIAASVYGGVLSYNAQPCEYKKLPLIPNLTAVYCGYKTPTIDVIKLMVANRQQNITLYDNIFQTMHVYVQRAIEAIKQADWQLLGQLMTQHHECQIALGTSDDLLNSLVQKLLSQQKIFGAKISGAGLGDCVIGLGEVGEDLNYTNQNILQFSLNIEQAGIVYANN